MRQALTWQELIEKMLKHPVRSLVLISISGITLFFLAPRIVPYYKAYLSSHKQAGKRVGGNGDVQQNVENNNGIMNQENR